MEQLSVVDLTTICRTCLNKDDEVYDVNWLSTCGWIQWMDGVKLEDLLDKLVFEDQADLDLNIPTKICLQCTQQFYNIHVFLQDCKKSQILLKNILNQNRNPNNDNSSQDNFLRSDIYYSEGSTEMTFYVEKNSDELMETNVNYTNLDINQDIAGIENIEEVENDVCDDSEDLDKRKQQETSSNAFDIEQDNNKQFDEIVNVVDENFGDQKQPESSDHIYWTRDESDSQQLEQQTGKNHHEFEAIVFDSLEHNEGQDVLKDNSDVIDAELEDNLNPRNEEKQLKSSVDSVGNGAKIRDEDENQDDLNSRDGDVDSLDEDVELQNNMDLPKENDIPNKTNNDLIDGHGDVGSDVELVDNLDTEDEDGTLTEYKKLTQVRDFKGNIIIYEKPESVIEQEFSDCVSSVKESKIDIEESSLDSSLDLFEVKTQSEDHVNELPEIEGFGYMCSTCDSPFINFSDLMKHKRKLGHNLEQIFVCPECEKKFFSYKNFYEHFRGHILCDSSDEDENNENGGLIDMDLKLRYKKPYTCKVCNLGLATKEKLNLHTEKYHNFETCEFCNVTMPKVNFEAHSLTCTTHKGDLTTYSCKKCSGKFNDEKMLQEHLKKMHSCRPFIQCEMCGFSCMGVKHLRSHMEKYHRGKKCPKCNKTFRNSQGLADHLKTIDTDEHKSICEYCGKRFIWRNSLLNHVKTQHLDTTKQPFNCNTFAMNLS